MEKEERSSRIRVERRAEALEVVIGPPGAWGPLAMSGLIGAGGIATVSRALCREAACGALGVRSLTLVVFGIVWLIMTWAMVRAPFFRTFGSEEMVIGPKRTTVTTRMLFFLRSRAFDTATITKITWAQRDGGTTKHGRRLPGHAVLRVVTREKTFDLRSPLSYPEANMLERELGLALEELQRPSERAGYRGEG